MIVMSYAIIDINLTVMEPCEIQRYKQKNPDSKVHGAVMGPTWVLSATDGTHVGPMNFAIREV